MRPFMGDMGSIIIVKNEIPEKNLEILKQLYPNARIVKQKDKEKVMKEIRNKK